MDENLERMWARAIAAKRDADKMDALSLDVGVGAVMYAHGRLDMAVVTLMDMTGGTRKSILAGLEVIA